MKIVSFLLPLALITLAGCSADDLTGPDAATDAVPLAAQAPTNDTARPDFAAETFSILGTWRASDRIGTITLFIDAADAPVLGTSRATVALEGKGIVNDVLSRPLAVLLEGEYQRHSIEIALLDPSGDTLAKGQGTFSTDRTAFKVVLIYNDGKQRPLEFTRL